MRNLYSLFTITLIASLGFLAGCSKETSKNPDLPDGTPTVRPQQRYMPKFPTPDAPKGYLTAGAPGFTEEESLAKEIEQHPLPQDPKLRKQLYDERLKAQRALTVELFDKFGKTKESWAPQAREALERVAQYYATIRVRQFEQDDEIKTMLTALIQAGCDDPQIRYFARIKNQPDNKGLEKYAEELDAIADQFEREKYPITRRYNSRWYSCVAKAQMLINEKNAVYPRWQLEDPNMVKRTVDCVKYFDTIWPYFAELAAVQTYENDKLILQRAEDLMNEYVNSGHDRKEAYDKIEKCLKAAPSSKWIRKAVEGRFHIDHAWDARGNKMAQFVKIGAFPVFHERLKEAETALGEAWEIDPTRTEAPAMMITVCMGSSEPRETMETWFKRAMEADPENVIACERKMQCLLPKWGGSFRQASTFAKQCAKTNNWYAKFAGIYLMILLSDSRLDIIDLSSPEIWQDIRAIFEPRIVEDPTDHYAMSIYARMAFIRGDCDLAHYLFLKLDSKPVYSNYSFASIIEYSTIAEKARVTFLENAVMKEQGTYNPQKTPVSKKTQRP